MSDGCAGDRRNPALARITIPSQNKNGILTELRRLNINQYTVFNDLEHLSVHINRAWKVS